MAHGFGPGISLMNKYLAIRFKFANHIHKDMHTADYQVILNYWFMICCNKECFELVEGQCYNPLMMGFPIEVLCHALLSNVTEVWISTRPDLMLMKELWAIANIAQTKEQVAELFRDC